MRILSLILLMFFSLGIKAQLTITEFKSFTCPEILAAGDIANSLEVGATKKVTLKCSPVGAGDAVEVASGRSKDKNYFQKEHNIVWVKFRAGKSGNLNFTLRPLSGDDDYDFLLFKAEGENTEELIKSKKLAPIRTNISRSNVQNLGLTGLSITAKETHNISGKNSAYSKYIVVKKGETYYLAIDNVYDGGKGVMIYFNYFLTKTIRGIIKNEKNEIVKNVVVSWEDGRTGETLVETKADAETGEFEMKVPIDEAKPKQKYVLSAYSEKHFFSEQSFTSTDVKDFNDEPINLVLNVLKKGNKNRLENINFHGDKAIFLKGAYPSLKRLFKLMKKNKTLTIVIEGHTNGCSGGVAKTQLLSVNRAKALKNYLIENGINAQRMQVKGFNCKFMLYPNPANEEESSLNRRVEILVTDL